MVQDRLHQNRYGNGKTGVGQKKRRHGKAGGIEGKGRKKEGGRFIGSGLTKLLFFTICLSTAAMAAKPAPPLQISCTTAAQTGDRYRAQCDVAAFGGTQPESVQLMPIKGEGVRLVKAAAPAAKNGVGLWALTLEFTNQRPASLRFKAVFANGATVQVGVLYDPFKNRRAEKPKKGRVVTDDKGNRVQEFPSQ